MPFSRSAPHEAERRGLGVEKLVERILRNVLESDLTAAVLHER